MNPVWIVLTMLGALVVQSTVLQVEPFSFVSPNICLVLLLFVSLLRGPKMALYLGMAIGLVQDILFGTYLGLHSFTYAAVGYFAGTTFRTFWSRQLVMVILIMLGYTFLHEFTLYALSGLFGFQRVDLLAAVTHAIRMCIWNGTLALLLYVPSVRLLGRRERRGMVSDESL